MKSSRYGDVFDFVCKNVRNVTLFAVNFSCFLTMQLLFRNGSCFRSSTWRTKVLRAEISTVMQLR